MNLLVKYIINNALILSMLPAVLQASYEADKQVDLVAEFFAEQLHASIDQIEIELIHMSRINQTSLQNDQIEVQYGRGELNLGHQTLWMVHKVNGRVQKRYPITVEVYANLAVPTAVRNISRLEKLSPELIVMVPQRIGREYRRLILNTDLIYGKMATQLIREGRPIERNMVRVRPAVLLGDDLQIILMDQGLKLELPGIAKQEGHIGQKIRVQCPATRKEFRGILENQNEVVVSLR